MWSSRWKWEWRLLAALATGAVLSVGYIATYAPAVWFRKEERALG